MASTAVSTSLPPEEPSAQPPHPPLIKRESEEGAVDLMPRSGDADSADGPLATAPLGLPETPGKSAGERKVIQHVLPTRNHAALVAYYCSIFALVPVAGLILGPVAIAYGILGLDRGRMLPRNIGYGHALFALVAGIIGSIISFGMAAALAVVMLVNYMGGSWPFPPENPLPQPAPEQLRAVRGPGSP
jgi:hypothetical protein